MAIIPHLAHHRATSVGTVLPCLGRVVPGPGAPYVGCGAVLLRQLALNVRQGILSAVTGRDLRLAQPRPGRKALVVLDRGLEEVDDLLVLTILRSIARDIKGREAGRMLGELVGPEVGVGRTLVDPIRIHPAEEVVLAEWGEEGVDTWALIGWYGGAVGKTSRGVGAGSWVVLAGQVAVLGVAAIAEVRPQAVQRPGICGEKLALRFEAGVGGPKLRGQ